MRYKLLASDYDNTLVPFGEKRPRPAVEAAVGRMQAAGAKFVLSTGRAWPAVRTPGQLGSIRFDYAVTCNGAYVVDRTGAPVYEHPLIPEEMYALVDFCEDYDYLLQFNFRDGYYAYCGYEALRRRYARMGSPGLACVDGEDQDRHLIDMPHAAFMICPEGALPAFEAKYGHLDDAQEQIERLQVALRRFKTELADVEIDADVQVTVDGFLKFADFFFDNLFTDWAVLDRIGQSQQQVRDTRRQIERVLARLKRMAAAQDSQMEDERERLEQIAREAEG